MTLLSEIWAAIKLALAIFGFFKPKELTGQQVIIAQQEKVLNEVEQKNIRDGLNNSDPSWVGRMRDKYRNKG